MDEYEVYLRRMKKSGTSLKQSLINNTIHKINLSFTDSPSHKIAIINNKKYDIRLIIDKDYSSNRMNIEYKALFRPTTDISPGMLLKVDEDYWLSMYVNESILYPKANILKCNQVFTFQDLDSLEVFKMPCVLQDKTSYYSDGINQGKLMTLADDQVMVSIPDNKYTRRIAKDRRFIFEHDKNSIYKSSKIDKLPYKGLINIIMKHVTYDKNIDDLDNNISQYINPNDSHNDSGQSSTNYKIKIVGYPKIFIGTSEHFKAKVYDNDGNEVNEKVNFKLESSIAYIDAQSDNKVSIKSKGQLGSIILEAYLVENEEISTKQKIQIVGL